MIKRKRGQPGNLKVDEADTISNEGRKEMMVFNGSPGVQRRSYRGRSWNHQEFSVKPVHRHLMRTLGGGSGSVRREHPICLHS